MARREHLKDEFTAPKNILKNIVVEGITVVDGENTGIKLSGVTSARIPGKSFNTGNKPRSELSNELFAQQDETFRMLCKAAGVEPTARQASKYRRGLGQARLARPKLIRDLTVEVNDLRERAKAAKGTPDQPTLGRAYKEKEDLLHRLIGVKQ